MSCCTTQYGVTVWIDKGRVKSSKPFQVHKNDSQKFVDHEAGKELAGTVLFETVDPLVMDRVGDSITYVADTEIECRHFINGVKVARNAQHTVERQRLANSLSDDITKN